ncbi:MAG: ABC transporter ATP-binding protein [Myxococcota bacterium]
MIEAMKQLYVLLSSDERRRAWKVLFLMTALAVLEATGVASIMPFLALLSSPELVAENKAVATLSELTGVSSVDSLLIVAGVLVFSLIVASLALQAIVVWAQVRYAGDLLHSWSCRIVDTYLGRPYEWFLAQHTSKLSATTINEVNQVIYHAVLPVLTIASNGLVVLFIFAFLVYVDPILAFTTVAALGGAYVAIYRFLRSRLIHSGESWVESNQGRYHVLSEAFGGIKEVKVLHAERSFASQFHSASRRMCDAMIRSKVIGQVPSFAMQGVVFGGMLLVVLYVLATRGSFAANLPLIGVYAFAGYKMMPALQRIYVWSAELEFSSGALGSIRGPLSRTDDPRPGLPPGDAQPNPSGRIRLQHALEFRDVSFHHPGADGPTLDKMSFSIPAGAKVGIVGSTGSGKTTTVDIMLGLLRPTAGTVVVDGREIGADDLRSWQVSTGYVPQSIFLADTTIAGNIAFGIEQDQIDHKRVETVSKLARLHDFVVRELPDAYETRAGERGVRFSGGERQRVGIARALYHDPDIVILDEATSALDNVTEARVMNAIDELAPSKTLVIIAHRLSTVRNCDTIFYLERGRVAALGTFEELRASHSHFRSLSDTEVEGAPAGLV